MPASAAPPAPAAPPPGFRERWFDDFSVGECFEFGAYTVTEAEIIDFATRYDPQPFHLDHAAAAASHFGGLVASGWMTNAVLMRLLCDHFIPRPAAMGSPGVDEIRWLKPVRPGDCLRARSEVVELRPSASKADRGLMKCRHALINQHDEVVMTMLGMGLYRRRQPAVSTPTPPGDLRLHAVEQFYDTHPISAAQIFDAVAARGIAAADITEAVLQDHDQDHYGGTAAVDRLMRHAAVQADDQVLDVCSGMGGPARYLAWKTGCRVTGLDLTASRVEGARALTAAAGLADRVSFVQGNALAMPFDDGTFTLAVSQEAFAHIPDKPRLVGQCARVLAAGGRLVFTDILSHQPLGEDDARQLFDGMRFSEIATVERYAQWLQAVGLQLVETVDLSAEWTRILVDRHAMYRSLRAQTVARLGQAHFDRYDRAYDHFVGLYQRGVLAGALIHARRVG